MRGQAQLRIHGHGNVEVKYTTEYLADLERAYDSVFLFESIIEDASRLPRYRGAIQALDAVIDGQIEVDRGDAGAVLTTERKALRVPARRLTIPAGPAGSVEIPVEPFLI